MLAQLSRHEHQHHLGGKGLPDAGQTVFLSLSISHTPVLCVPLHCRDTLSLFVKVLTHTVMYKTVTYKTRSNTGLQIFLSYNSDLELHTLAHRHIMFYPVLYIYSSANDQ